MNFIKSFNWNILNNKYFYIIKNIKNLIKRIFNKIIFIKKLIFIIIFNINKT